MTHGRCLFQDEDADSQGSFSPGSFDFPESSDSDTSRSGHSQSRRGTGGYRNCLYLLAIYEGLQSCQHDR